VKSISPEASQILQQYDYPGNVRELENIIERALAICSGPAIERQHLPLNLTQSRGLEKSHNTTPRKNPTVKSLQENERDYIIHILKSVNGNKTQAAKLMGIDRVSLWRKLNKYKEEGLDIDRLFES
jgi:transcriptional regulator with PAS, ATPase and Fis domain